jgi:hypothetical protein
MGIVTTHWRISPAAWVPIGLAVVAEATSNALRAYGLGTHLEAFTTTVAGYTISVAGVVLVLAACAISLSQARAAWVAMMASEKRQRIVGWLIVALLLSVSITAMASTILEAQRAKNSEEGDTRDRYVRAEAAYTNANDELTKLVKANVRTVAKVQADIDAVKVSGGVLSETKQCTNLKGDLADYRKACQPLLDRRSELADAQRKAELEAKVSTLKAEADYEKPREKAETSEELFSKAWAWILGVAVVFVATFGPVIFAKSEIETDKERDLPAERSALCLRSNRLPTPISDRSARFTREEAELFVVTELALGRSIPSQDALAEWCGRSKSTVSDWIRRWERSGIIPGRTKAGRCKTLVAANGTME